MSAMIDTRFFGIQEEIILTKNGAWLSNGEPITHPGTLRAFSKNIFRNSTGFEIRLGHGDQQEQKKIHVEDTPYFIRSLDGNPTEGYTLNLSDERKIKLDPTTLSYTPDRLICKVPHPSEDTSEEAKFLSTAYYELLKHLEITSEGYSITIQGKLVIFAGIL